MTQPVMTQKDDVLAALRLGWGVAEVRGRNRPDAPTTEVAPMPDRIDHPLPLRIERGATEQRIEAQVVVAAVARELHINPLGLDDSAKVLDHTRAHKAAAALQRALTLLRSNNAAEALSVLRAGQTAQCDVVKRRAEAVEAAKRAHVQRGPRALHVEKLCLIGEAHGLAALDEAIHKILEDGPAVGIEAIQQRQHEIAADVAKRWDSLAELIWQFDAHVQDRLAAASETQAIAYQLGRGLAETYWALNPDATNGTASWGFLLGKERCSELCRLIGRLSAYFDEYTAPAVVGSVEVWRAVVSTPAWLGDRQATQHALYRQIRRWFELLVLGQDPTTLVPPGAVMKDYKALRRAMRLFLPQLVGIAIGLGFLIALLILVSLGSGTALLKTVSGIVGVGGLSIAGLTGALKNSAQALLKRWRQDSYTDLVARAVQTAPQPPKKSAVQAAIRRRTLTPATN